jgi:hypothetical protein
MGRQHNRSGLKPWYLVRKPSLLPRGSSAGTHTSRRQMVCSQPRFISCVRLRSTLSPTTAENGTAKCPESLCQRSALPPSIDVNGLLPGHYSQVIAPTLQTHASVPLVLLSFSLSLVRGVSAGRYQPQPRRSRGVHFPVSSSTSSAFPPYTIEVGFPRVPVETISRRIAFSGLQPFLYVQGPQVCSHPRSFLPLRLIVAAFTGLASTAVSEPARTRSLVDEVSHGQLPFISHGATCICS